ncbi:MAG TPA: hypothetical protein VGM78_12750, partial [Ilumatobacteraceae bacterium]
VQSKGRAAITLRFEATATTFSIEGTTPADALDFGRNDIALATAVLDAVSDDHQIAFVDDRVMMRVVKNIAAANAGSLA